MIVLRQAEVYAPQFTGRQDILIAGGEIVKMAEHLDCGQVQEIDASGKIAVPGLIDPAHSHHRRRRRRQLSYENAGSSAFFSD